jgi:hypothetical protein
MKHHVPDEIRKLGFDCFRSLNEAERAVVMFGEDEYRKSLDKLSKEEMRAKIKEFSALLKSQREHWDKEDKIGFTYSCDMISQSLITLYIRLGRD